MKDFRTVNRLKYIPLLPHGFDEQQDSEHAREQAARQSGPTPLPLLGNLLTILANEPGYDAFEMWRKKYGPVYTYWIGILPFVVVADYKTMKETFVKDGDAYAGKFTIKEVTRDYRGPH
ncbi:hypothetical protein TELCIR_17415 [Teladorsagia circumcincta]|uniref:Cytochrome P450 n=1 Tax=Teladorsagia circumcincta TaxID=45464 RepID=A0A2G9TUY6_TELCI|nr:hypothetical protein TELCIR_17415 [Teladorsagia circumcincta]